MKRHIWTIEEGPLVISVYRENTELYEFQACTHGGWVDVNRDDEYFEERTDVLKHINALALGHDCIVMVEA